jgi:hypothetical protein
MPKSKAGKLDQDGRRLRRARKDQAYLLKGVDADVELTRAADFQ